MTTFSAKQQYSFIFFFTFNELVSYKYQICYIATKHIEDDYNLTYYLGSWSTETFNCILVIRRTVNLAAIAKDEKGSNNQYDEKL